LKASTANKVPAKLGDKFTDPLPCLRPNMGNITHRKVSITVKVMDEPGNPLPCSREKD
jgi:hypothetical protein